MPEEDESIGYKKPPKHTRFQKGRCYNPKGRPRKKSAGHILSPYVTMRIDGKLVKARREEAGLFSLLIKGLKERDPVALSAFLQHRREMLPERREVDSQIRFVRGGRVDQSSCDELFEVLGVLQQLPSDKTDRPPVFALTIWMLEEALKRFQGEVFSEEQIETIARDTIDPARAREILHEFVTKTVPGRRAYRKFA